MDVGDRVVGSVLGLALGDALGAPFEGRLVETAGEARRIDGPDQGFCLFTAGLALQALLRTGDYETEVRRVVSLGRDTDTNAAVAGALIGALAGERGLPRAWLARLRDDDAIRTEVEALVPPAPGQTRRVDLVRAVRSCICCKGLFDSA